MRCADTAAVVAVEVLVEEDVVPEMWIVLHFFAVVEDRASGGLSLRKMRVRRRASSFATSRMVRYFPEPVGHSIVKSFPYSYGTFGAIR
jgi:hypothetical protein